MWNQFPEQGVRAELSREMGRYGAAAAASLPSQSSLAAMNPLGSPSWLIAREKKSSRSQVRRVFLCCCCSLLTVSNGRGTGSSSCIAHVPQETCHFLRVPTDHHSHILHSNITSFSSFSNSTITHCQILYYSSSVSSNYPLYYSLTGPVPSSPMSFLCTTCDSA